MNALRNVYLELSSKCVCACPKCPRTIMKGLYEEKDLSMDIIEQIIRAQPEKVHLLGNLGDPIYHDRFIDIIRMLGDSKIQFNVYTVGSGFNEDWWRDVYSSYQDVGHEKNTWVFSVDGVGKSAGIYRKGLNFEQSFAAMRLGRELKKKIKWQYIVFSSNQDDIPEAKRLAESYGIDLRIDFNEKWDSESDEWKPTKSRSELGI